MPRHRSRTERPTGRAVQDLPAEEFRRAGHRLVDQLADFLDSMPDGPVNRNESPREVQALLPRDELPESGGPAERLVSETARLLFDHSLFNGHPRFFGYITSSAAPTGALADFLAAMVNANLGGWQLSPIATEIENQALRWVADLLGYPRDCGGLFVSGGNVANFVGFLAARNARAPWSLRTEGLGAGPGRLLVYATSETHTWIQKATDLFGHGTTAVRVVPHDRDMRADVAEIGRMIAEDRNRGDVPFLLVATTGTVSTGAVDPVDAMADVAAEHGLWLHVDGAYGALAAAVPGVDASLRSIGRADSVAVDPHKWLYAPLEAGCTLVRDPEALPAAFAYRPPYYRFEEGDEPRTNFYEHGLQNSRGFRALKVWLGIRQAGRKGIVDAIADDIRLAERLHRVLGESDEIEVLTLGLSIVTFRFVPSEPPGADDDRERYLNRLNERLLDRLNTSGEAYLSNAVVHGRYALRACIVNFRTSPIDVDAVPEVVVRHGRAIVAEAKEAES